MAIPNDGAPAATRPNETADERFQRELDEALERAGRQYEADMKARANSAAVRDAIENGLHLRRAIGLLCDQFTAKEIRKRETELSAAVREFRPNPRLETFVEGDPARATELIAARDRARDKGLRIVLARLASGHLQAVGRLGGLHGPWRRIAAPEWSALEVVSLQAGHVRGGGVDYWDIRAADPKPILLEVAFRAFGNPPDVEEFDLWDHYSSCRPLGPHEAGHLSGTAGMLFDSLRARLISGELQGSCDGELQPPETWADLPLSLLASSTKLPGRVMVSEVRVSMPLRADDADAAPLASTRSRERFPEDRGFVKQMPNLIHPDDGSPGMTPWQAAGSFWKPGTLTSYESMQTRIYNKYKSSLVTDKS